MKANEIQISDWLYSIIDRGDHTEKKLCKVTGIRTDSDVPLIQCDDTDVWYPLDSYEPIPLTAEILEKNGFSIDYCNDDLSYAQSCGDVIGIHIYGKNGLMDEMYFKYVHQLQQALRLCGITLNIEV